MAWRQDTRRERHVSWTRAVYAGEHGASKGACHKGKDELLHLFAVNFGGRYGMELNQSSTSPGSVREVIDHKRYSIRSWLSYVEWVSRFGPFLRSSINGLERSGFAGFIPFGRNAKFGQMPPLGRHMAN